MDPAAASSAEPASMVECPDCGKQVPELNMTIHKVRACQGRARRASAEEQEEKEPRHDVEQEEPTPMDIDDDNDDNDDSSTKPKAETTATPRSDRIRPAEEAALGTPSTGIRQRRNKRRTQGAAEGEDILQVADVVDLVQDPDVIDLVSPGRNDSTSAAASNDNNSSSDYDEWACPQCTLLNPKARATCGACHYRNPNRPPDPTRSDRLIDDDYQFSTNSGNTMPMSYVGHGALLGGVLGAAGSFMHGRSMLSGAAEGAVTGVVGGALLNEVLNVSSTASSENYNPNISEARSSAAMGTPAYPSFTSSEETRNRRARPRSSYRVIQRRDDNGGMTTIIQGGSGGSTRVTRRSMGGAGAHLNDPMLSLMLHNLMQQGGGGGAAGARRRASDSMMDYEQLLQAFGDGTENMGADESQISRLPTQDLQNPESELPEDARQCLICLEDFASGETRITMPCLHGFHKECAEKWLRTNGSCPICKHRLE